MESNVRDLTEALGERLSLTAEEDVGVDLEDADEVDLARRHSRYCLVGKVLIRKRYNMEAMENTLAGVWRPVKGMHMRVLDQNLFAFYFFHPVDMQRVLAVGPWKFSNHVMVLQEAQDGRQVTTEDLYEVLFWVQIHGLPPDRLTAASGRRIGEELGRFIEVDDGGGDAWGVEYIRVRVALDARKPLRRGMKLSLRMGQIWVDFRYERLPNFCYCCGMLDHVEWDCELGLDMEKQGVTERPYSEELRAQPKSRQRIDETHGGRWLRDAAGNPVAAKVGHGRSILSLASARNKGLVGSFAGYEQSNWRIGKGVTDGECKESNPGGSLLEESADANRHNTSCRLRIEHIDSPSDPDITDTARAVRMKEAIVITDVPSTHQSNGRESEAQGNFKLTGQGSTGLEGPILNQVHQGPTQTNQDCGSIFVFASGSTHSDRKTRAWKREARERRPAQSFRLKRKDEPVLQVDGSQATCEKRGRGEGVDGNQIILSAGAAQQARRSP
ncbi:hypothetical protein SLA2020_095260 [Shorea laevis]